MTSRGGYQPPQNPAPVSGPGALSARTDGGPGNQRQPIRVAPGQPYGERQAMEELQGSAPMAAAGGGAPPAQQGAPPPMDLTGPTMRPTPVNTRLGGNVGDPGETQAMLRMMYMAYPHPALARLIPEGS